MATSLIAFSVGIMVGFSFTDYRARKNNFEMKKLAYEDVKILNQMADSIKNEICFDHLERIEDFINKYKQIVKKVYEDY